jgi:ketosteroid isomerase-like protein
MDHRETVQRFMGAMADGDLQPMFDAMHEDVSWRWMGVRQWSKTFVGKRDVVQELFGGAAETLSGSFSVVVHGILADGDCVVVEHTGRNQTPDGRPYHNNYCWVLEFDGELIREIREYMDTQLVTETFGADEESRD